MTHPVKKVAKGNDYADDRIKAFAAARRKRSHPGKGPTTMYRKSNKMTKGMAYQGR